MSDNPRVRASTTCPLCRGAKATGLIACWPCFRRWDMRHGNPNAERVIEGRELELRELAWQREHGWGG